ncbi:MAG: hypothetical protein H7249_11450 [Chitinophagaceae bacterium]|nr:hypothetical protein [Oligoflexus sp.]
MQANGTFQPGHLDIHEKVALRWYTTNQFATMNLPLRSQDAARLTEYEATIKLLASAINKIPAKSCTVLRGTHLRPAVLTAILAKNDFIDLAFLSTTSATSLPVAFTQGNATFHITSKRCRDISWASEIPTEKEIRSPPGSEFQVVDVKTKGAGESAYYDIFLVHKTTRDIGNEATAGPASLRAVKGIVKLTLGTAKGQSAPLTPAERRPTKKLPSSWA